MVMIGLVSREPGSKRRYGALVLAATQFLNLYCHTIWVSGKMMRCVSRLNQLVQRALAIDPHDSQGQHSLSTEGRDSGAENLLLTPQAEGPGPCQIQPRIGTSTIYANELNEMSIDDGQDSRRNQGSERYMYNNDTSSTVAGRSAGDIGRSGQLPASWMAGPSVDSRSDWIMSDFNFEIFGERFGSTGAECSRLLDNERLGGVSPVNSTADRDVGEGRLGVLGLNGVFNLGVDFGPTMNLYDNSPTDVDILG